MDINLRAVVKNNKYKKVGSTTFMPLAPLFTRAEMKLFVFFMNANSAYAEPRNKNTIRKVRLNT